MLHADTAAPDRLYAVLDVRTIDPARRRFAGVATTPTPDRRGDVIDPAGLTFTNPVPLLLHHDTERPIGWAYLSSATAAGVAFEAELAEVKEPGTLRDRITEAWQSITAKLLRGVSIGVLVRPRDTRPRREGGAHVARAEVVELSVVSIPMNREASILEIKAIDRAALGLPPSGDPALPRGAVMFNFNREHNQEQITKWEGTRGTTASRMASLLADAEAAGTVLSGDGATEYETCRKSLSEIDAHLGRLREQEEILKGRATPISAAPPPERPGAPGVASVITFGAPSKLAPGTAFTRYAMALAAAKGNRHEALEFSRQWRDSTPDVELVLKAAVAAGTTTDAQWAAPLVPLRTMAQEFMALLRPATILGRIPNLREVPFNAQIPIQTGGGSYQWVGQGAAKPVTKLTFAGSAALPITKAAGIIVLTEELVRSSSPSAEAVCRADMIAGIAQFLDAQFVDPANAGILNVAPASITNGVAPIASVDPFTDLGALVSAHIAAGLPLGTAVLLMSEQNAFALGATIPATGGGAVFPGMTVQGGSLYGIRVITSQAMADNVVLFDPQSILVADDGQTVLDSSREASVQMDSAPSNPPDATTVLTSLWQNNLVGLRAERFINWLRGRNNAVHWVDGAAYAPGPLSFSAPTP